MKNNQLKKPFGGIILDSSFRIIIPFTLVYGMYILTHGEYSPGGGFQAGALLAVGIVLVRLIQGADKERVARKLLMTSIVPASLMVIYLLIII